MVMGGVDPPKFFRIFYMGKVTKTSLSHCGRSVDSESRVGRFSRTGSYILSIFEQFDTLVPGIDNNPRDIQLF
jgi:hypothetical protein